MDDPSKERLQKILARAGYGSRRACEELIVEGRVTVNSQAVSVLGVRADPFRDVIAVDGERVHMPRPAYWMLNKAEGVSFNDAEGEEGLQHLLKGEQGRLFTAGRLDRFARGLVLITNDGRVSNILTHPRYRVPKVYRLSLKGSLQAASAKNIERALYYSMNGGRFEPLKLVKHGGSKSQVLLTVYEGLPQALRDICLKYDHAIRTLERVRIGPLQLDATPVGVPRKLRADEIQALLAYADDAENGRIDYEQPLVSPARFDRDESAGFRRKKIGTRGTTDGGQKQVRARTRGGERPPRHGPRRDKAAAREGSRDRAPRRDGGPTREGGPRRERGPRREGGPRGDRGGPRREGGPRGDRGGPRREGGPRGDKRRPKRDSRGPRRDRPPRKD